MSQSLTQPVGWSVSQSVSQVLTHLVSSYLPWHGDDAADVFTGSLPANIDSEALGPLANSSVPRAPSLPFPARTRAPHSSEG